jgi:hypothetical protein
VRWIAILCGAAGAAFLVGAFQFARVGQITVGLELMLSGSPFSHVAYFILIGALIAVTWLTTTRLRWSSPDRSEAPPDVLFAIAVAAPALGLLVAAYEGLNIYRAASRLHVTNVAVIAPTVAEALLVASVGLLVGATAAALSAVLTIQYRSRPS